MGQYHLGAIGWYDAAASQTAMGGLTNLDFPTEAQVVSDDGGSIYDEQQALANFSPVVNATTKNIKTILDTIALSGQCILPAPETLTQVDVYSRKIATCDAALGATPHMRHRITRGLVRRDRLTATRGQDAEMSVTVDTLSDDGVNNPVAETDGVALPATIVTQQYTLGVCKIAGVVLSEIDEVTIEYQITNSEKIPALASVYPTSLGVLKVRPVLTLRGRDIAKVKSGSIELGATGATHLNTLIQLVQRENAGTFKTFGSGDNHITMTMDGTVVPDNLASGSGNSRSQYTLRLVSRFDGTNVPIVEDTTANYDATP